MAFLRSVYLRTVLLCVVTVPSFAHAAIASPRDDLQIKEIFAGITKILNLIIPFLLLLATVIFLWGVVKYITAGGDESKVAEARKLIIYGIIALAAMVAVWGLVFVLVNAIFGTTNLPALPGPDLDPFL